MSEGKFIQLGVTASQSGPAADGYGQFVTVQRLEQLHQERVLEQLRATRPELLASGIKAVRQKLEADEAFEQLRKDLFAALGGDGVNVSIGIMTDEAKRQIAADRKAASGQTKLQAKK